MTLSISCITVRINCVTAPLTTMKGWFREAALAVEDDENLDTERAMVLGLLSHSAVFVEELIMLSGVEARIVNVILLELELAGMLERHRGGRVSRRYED